MVEGIIAPRSLADLPELAAFLSDSSSRNSYCSIEIQQYICIVANEDKLRPNQRYLLDADSEITAVCDLSDKGLVCS